MAENRTEHDEWKGRTEESTTGNAALPTCNGARQGACLTAARQAASLLRHAIAETVWTSRCVVCDTPGDLLCKRCLVLLPYVDRWRACPRCGAPNGQVLCTECNSFSLGQQGITRLPYGGCVSAIEHIGPARSIVTAYKDAGERRLAATIARIVFWSLPPEWLHRLNAICFVPADKHARRRRGFDHMALVADELATLSGMPVLPLLGKRHTADQRGLSREERIANMAASITFEGPPNGALPRGILLIDDVQTTGATLFASSQALRDGGVPQICCASFARRV